MFKLALANASRSKSISVIVCFVYNVMLRNKCTMNKLNSIYIHQQCYRRRAEIMETEVNGGTGLRRILEAFPVNE